MNYYDIVKLFSINSLIHCFNKLFPTNIKNRLPTNLIGLYHFLGAAMILCGIFANPKYLYIHIFLTTFILFTYYIFNDNCYVTLLSNFLCEKSTNPLVVPIYKVNNWCILY